ncbi:MAG: glycosyltransferase [Calditrichaeota bacterium]|nr:glycosyltransferase [Calditrichota bacterium]
MMEIWAICLILGGGVYLIFVSKIISGLIRLQSETAINSDYTPRVSIVIAARNEEKDIGNTLQHVLAQDYSEEMYEVIVVDDRSEDDTSKIVKTLSETDPRVQHIRQTEIEEHLSPKKQALERGIQTAIGEIIITTDADCIPAKGWIRALVSRFKPDTGMVLGQARFEIGESPPLWQRLQSLDFRSQGYAAAGLAVSGMPFSCTGASLAFRKQAYEDVNGYDGVTKLISGDDELLLAKICQSKWKVNVSRETDVVVPTRPPLSLRELWFQRIRWGSKALFIQTSRKLFLMGVFLFLLSLSIGPIVSILFSSWWLLIGMFTLKCVLDLLSVAIGKTVYREKVNWIDFFLLELIHAPALVLLTTAGHIFSFEWKGQTFHSQGSAK